MHGLVEKSESRTYQSTCGTRIAGTILRVSGWATLFVAFLGYVYLILLIVLMLSGLTTRDPGGVLVILGFWLGSVLLHSIGQVMRRAGDYLQGKFGQLSQSVILRMSIYHLLKDVCVVQVALSTITCAMFLFAVKMVMVAVWLTVAVAFSVAAYKFDRRLNALDAHRKKKYEPIIF